MRVKYLYILFLLLLSQFSFTQNKTEIFNFTNAILKLEFEESLAIASSINSPANNKFILLAKIIEDDGYSKLSFNNDLVILNENNKIEVYLFNLINGYQYLYYNKNRQKSYDYFNTAFNISRKYQLKSLEKLSLFSLLNFYMKGLLQGTRDYQFYLKKYKNLCNTTSDWVHYYSFKYNLLSQTETYNETLSLKNEAYNAIFKLYDSLIESSSNNLNKLNYLYYKDKANNIIRKQPNKAKKLFIKSKSYFNNSNYFKRQTYIYYTNLSRVFSLKKKYLEGLKILAEAKKFISANDSILDMYYLHIYQSNFFYNLKQYDSAYIYEKKVRYLGYEINFQQENQNVSEFRTKLNTAEKEKQNLELLQKNKQKLNLLIIGLLLFILITTSGILIIKNSKRKRKLAEQEKALEIQKNLTLLKEQEISTINAMVEGQEKERKRVAEDLHDNLGSVLATLKLHFDNLKMNNKKKKFNQEELFHKTENLIDEAYLKVRRIAHAKNAGVIANHGLLPAVQMMAEKISAADKIKIEVIHFGLNERFDNSLEITVFRIIQELITNILKHANAKNATINIAVYDNVLNLIIEDDGIGFDIKRVNLKNGIGINSIKTRVKHLKGNFTIDATIGKGSSFIIDIPIA